MTDTTTPDAAEAGTELALGELEHLDPNSLHLGDNVREYANLNKPFLGGGDNLDRMPEHGRDLSARRFAQAGAKTGYWANERSPGRMQFTAFAVCPNSDRRYYTLGAIADGQCSRQTRHAKFAGI